METKKEMKFFTVVDFDREEDYLRRMHQSGWKLSKVKFMTYYFDKAEPEDVVYKLDYRRDQKEKEAYVRLFADYGWEYLQDVNGFSYFRKPSAQFEEGEAEELFNDRESKLAMVKRVIATTLGLQVFVLFLNLYNLHLSGRTLPFGLDWIMLTVLVILVGVMVYVCSGYLRLQKKIKN